MAVLTIRSLAPAAVLAASVGAQILSCADVECPIVPGTTFAKCTVVNKSFNAVGVARIDTDIDEFNGLSWVKAVGAEDVNSTTREFYQSFYLGTPAESSNLDGAGSACAVFFTQVSDRVRFGDGDPRGTEGTCRQALGESCVSALVDRAKAVDLDGLSGQAACDKLQREFSDNLDAACADSATGRRWTGIRVQGKSGQCIQERIETMERTTLICAVFRRSAFRRRGSTAHQGPAECDVDLLADPAKGPRPETGRGCHKTCKFIFFFVCMGLMLGLWH